MKPSFVTNQN